MFLVVGFFFFFFLGGGGGGIEEIYMIAVQTFVRLFCLAIA